jgi:hypothetical protein
MGQFKPMVKMETTEPSVELKLKRGGVVKMKNGGSTTKAKKMAMGGGAMDMMAGTPALVGRPAVNAPVRAPGKPSMAARRKAMMAKKPSIPMTDPSMPAGNPGLPAMKEGGDMAQDKAMIKKAFKQHDSQEHKGGKGTDLKLKKGGMNKGGMATGGVSLGNAGGFKTGGVALGNGGGYATGGVTLGNAGGFKHGGKSSKKAYATGGTVNSGKPVAMPQGNKKPSAPVSINQLSGTFKKGGTVKMNGGGTTSGQGPITDQERKIYEDLSKGAYDKTGKYNRELEEAMNPLSMVKELAGKAKDYFMPKTADSVTKTKESVTVSPASKKRGGVAC